MSLEEMWDVVGAIPPGRVASYGDVGAALSSPTSGRIVGRWMAQCPPEVPWWRVVDRNGRFPIGKRDPHMEYEQGEILAQEGVAILNNRVDMAVHRTIL